MARRTLHGGILSHPTHGLDQLPTSLLCHHWNHGRPYQLCPCIGLTALLHCLKHKANPFPTDDHWLTISQRWGEEHDAIWKPFEPRKSSQWWTTTLIQQLLDMAYDMWHHCNEVLHNLPDNQASIIDMVINQELQELYDLGPHALPRDALYLRKWTAEQLKQLSITYKYQ